MGGKAAHLARLTGNTSLPVPYGFVITAGAFQYFMESNRLQPEINRLLRKVCLSHPEELEDLCKEMQQLILKAEIPDAVADGIRRAGRVLAMEHNSFALRSSGAGEDSATMSFAGQYDSILGVPVDQISDEYKSVLASKYGPRAVSYRIRTGLSDLQTPMAVLVMPMVEAVASGVMYTRDRSHCRSEKDVTALFTVPGTGESLVSGKTIPHLACIPRDGHPDPSNIPASDLLKNEEMI
ncbi:MAG: PEP/pyruvate-binding domain-containing protein, partial [Desulfovibrionales bacterium]